MNWMLSSSSPTTTTSPSACQVGTGSCAGPSATEADTTSPIARVIRPLTSNPENRMKTHAERLCRHLDFLVENLFRKNPPMPLREAVARLSKKDRSVNLDLVAHWYQDRNTIQWGNYLHEIAEKLEALLLR